MKSGRWRWWTRAQHLRCSENLSPSPPLGRPHYLKEAVLGFAAASIWASWSAITRLAIRTSPDFSQGSVHRDPESEKIGLVQRLVPGPRESFNGDSVSPPSPSRGEGRGEGQTSEGEGSPHCGARTKSAERARLLRRALTPAEFALRTRIRGRQRRPTLGTLRGRATRRQAMRPRLSRGPHLGQRCH
jgi:hypothetical protein